MLWLATGVLALLLAVAVTLVALSGPGIDRYHERRRRTWLG